MQRGLDGKECKALKPDALLLMVESVTSMSKTPAEDIEVVVPVFPGHVYHVVPFLAVQSNFTREPDDAVVGQGVAVHVEGSRAAVWVGGFRLLCSAQGVTIEDAP